MGKEESGENNITRSFMLCTSHEILFADQVKKIEMGRTCGTYGGDETFIQGFSGET
jgi:hypothetical protein